jgi:plasmid stability protein
MAQLLVRNLDDGVKERLRQLADRHGRSLVLEVREILTGAAAQLPHGTEPGLGTRIAARFAGLGLDTEFPELRGYPAKPAEFDP